MSTGDEFLDSMPEFKALALKVSGMNRTINTSSALISFLTNRPEMDAIRKDPKFIELSAAHVESLKNLL